MVVYFDETDDDKVHRRRSRLCITVERPAKSAAIGYTGAG